MAYSLKHISAEHGKLAETGNIGIFGRKSTPQQPTQDVALVSSTGSSGNGALPVGLVHNCDTCKNFFLLPGSKYLELLNQYAHMLFITRTQM